MAQKVYFLADDDVHAFNSDLWVSDGTAAGTMPIGGVANLGVADSATDGLGPEFLTVFGSQMIFAGSDSLNDAETNGLWLTDGTAGGTTEVGGPSPGPGKSSPFTLGNPSGLEPSNFTVFGGKAIFTGLDSASNDALWVTDGTTGGTLELGGLDNSGIVGSKVGGFSTENFAAFGNSVLFDGYDTTGFQGLWISDGTTAGTVELGGTQNQGIFDSGVSNFVANNFITLGSLELFNAPNKTGNQSLWVTDGTAGGTVEVGGNANAAIGGANNVGLGNGLANAVRMGDRVLFSGADTGGNTGLWATDGTAPGTAEIGGIGDAAVVGVGPLGLNPTDLTVNGPYVLFNGVDDNGSNNELWRSDGTATGTIKLSGNLLNEAANGLQPEDIVSLGNGKAVFIGFDNSNNQNSGKATLWVTDGTSAGTQEIGGLNNDNIPDANAAGLIPEVDSLMGGDGLAYFIAEDTTTSTDVLWETDGTQNGTKIVPGTNADTDGIRPENMTLGPVPTADDTFSGSGQSINLATVPGEDATLAPADATPDTVTGSNGTINLIAAVASIIGGGNLISFAYQAGKNASNSPFKDSVTLSHTNNNKDTVTTGDYTTKGAITLSGAQANVYGEGDTITFASGTTGNVVNIFDTNGDGDTVNGANGTVNVYSSQAFVNGGNDTVNLYGAGSSVNVEGTGASFDTVNGSNATIEISNGAGAYVYGSNDTITLDSGGTLSITGGHALTLNQTESLTGAVVGAGVLAITGGATTIHSGATLTVAKIVESGASTAITVGTVGYAGGLTQNSGTLSASGTFSLSGTESLSGKVNGSGELAITGGATTIHSGASVSVSKLLVSGASTTLTLGSFSYAGALTESSGTISELGTLSLTGTESLSGSVIGVGELAVTGGATTIHSGATLTVAKLLESGASTTLTAGTVSYAGALTQNSGTLAVLGTFSVSGTDSLSAKVNGTGKLSIAGGTTTIHSGASLAESGLSILGAATDVTLDENLTYAGAFSMAAGTLDLAAGNLTLTGADSFTGGTVDGAHILLTQGASATSVANLKIGGTVEWENTKTVNQTSQVTLGDSSGNIAFLDNTSTGIYDLLGNTGFSEGTSASSYILNAGLLEKTSGTGLGAIKPKITNTGTIKVTAGTLELKGAITGTGAETISGASTLQFDSTVAAGQTISFTGSGGTLDLASPQGFAGAIKGFDVGGGTNDALDIISGWSFTGASEGGTSATLGFVNGVTHVNVVLQGAYTGTFNHTAITGGTQITYTA